MDFPFIPAMETLKKELENCRFTGQCPGGLVRITVGPDQFVVAAEVDPTLLDPCKKELVAKCIVEAVNDAWNSCRSGLLDKVAQLFGGPPFRQSEGGHRE
ncbi:MAG: YbaB/EbfC family nucleoid-associated protein [Bacillota bacterium]